MAEPQKTSETIGRAEKYKRLRKRILDNAPAYCVECDTLITVEEHRGNSGAIYYTYQCSNCSAKGEVYVPWYLSIVKAFKDRTIQSIFKWISTGTLVGVFGTYFAMNQIPFFSQGERETTNTPTIAATPSSSPSKPKPETIKSGPEEKSLPHKQEVPENKLSKVISSPLLRPEDTYHLGIHFSENNSRNLERSKELLLETLKKHEAGNIELSPREDQNLVGSLLGTFLPYKLLEKEEILGLRAYIDQKYQFTNPILKYYYLGVCDHNLYIVTGDLKYNYQALKNYLEYFSRAEDAISQAINDFRQFSKAQILEAEEIDTIITLINTERRSEIQPYIRKVEEAIQGEA